MHELAICQGLINQAERIAREEGAGQVDNIVLSIGPLSGVEPPLLDRAFEIARMGTMAENAELEIQTGPIVVKCRTCGSSGEASRGGCMVDPPFERTRARRRSIDAARANGPGVVDRYG